MGILEVQIEDKFVAFVEDQGDICIKMNIRGRRGWPDRLTVMKNGHCFFIEFKIPGEIPGKLQMHIHNRLKRKGHRIYVCDGYEEAISAYQREEVYASQLSEKVNRISS